MPFGRKDDDVYYYSEECIVQVYYLTSRQASPVPELRQSSAYLHAHVAIVRAKQVVLLWSLSICT